MSSKSVKLYLEDILTSIARISEYTKGFSFDKFINDQRTIDAVIRNLEIIGEAAKNIPEEFSRDYPDIPWQEMISMRNKVIHEYFGIDTNILWQTICEDLPKLKVQIENLPF